MRFSTVAAITVSMLSSVALADLHWSGLCITDKNGYNVYHSDATEKACTAYKNRNTGSEQWDTCPDCKMSTVGGLTFCHSEAQHIGGDELNYYCTQNGASGSLAD